MASWRIFQSFNILSDINTWAQQNHKGFENNSFYTCLKGRNRMLWVRIITGKKTASSWVITFMNIFQRVTWGGDLSFGWEGGNAPFAYSLVTDLVANRSLVEESNISEFYTKHTGLRLLERIIWKQHIATPHSMSLPRLPRIPLQEGNNISPLYYTSPTLKFDFKSEISFYKYGMSLKMYVSTYILFSIIKEWSIREWIHD